MTQLTMFVGEVAMSLVASALVVGVLARPLRTLLADVCGTPERARFWVAYCNIMIFIAPLAATVLLGKSGQLSEPTVGFFKAALGSALFGIFVALAAIGLQIAKFLPRTAPARDPERPPATSNASS